MIEVAKREEHETTVVAFRLLTTDLDRLMKKKGPGETKSELMRRVVQDFIIRQ